MVQEDGDYADYSRHVTTTMSGLTVLSGFVFTVITLLVTRLERPITLYPQLLLLFLAVIFDLNLFLYYHLLVETIYLCRNIPPQTRRITLRVRLMGLTFTLFGFSVPFMFLLFNLAYLAATSTAAWILVAVAAWVLIYKPLMAFREKHRG